MSFLASLVEVILEKMKWDEEADPDDVDEDDKVAFEGLRKVRGSPSWDNPSSIRSDQLSA